MTPSGTHGTQGEDRDQGRHQRGTETKTGQPRPQLRATLCDLRHAVSSVPAGPRTQLHTERDGAVAWHSAPTVVWLQGRDKQPGPLPLLGLPLARTSATFISAQSHGTEGLATAVRSPHCPALRNVLAHACHKQMPCLGYTTV